MVEFRRAYRGWLLKRLAWLIPGFLVCCLIGGRVLLESAGSPGAAIPSLAIVAGSLVLFGTMIFRSAQVFRVASRGGRARARTLRRVLGPYRELSMAGIAAVLSLAAIPLLFGRPDPLREVAVLRPSQGRPSHGRPGAGGAEASAVASIPEPPSLPEAPTETPTPLAAAPPQVLPERIQAPELPRLEDDPVFVPPLPLTVPTLPAQDAPPRGREEADVPQRPEALDFSRSLVAAPRESTLDRGGLPSESNVGLLPLPELCLDITVVPGSGHWRGSILETSFDLPLNQNESLRMTYFVAAMNNEGDKTDFEATLAWHRVTLAYERKLVGYTRHATFDLSLRVGATADVISEHESGITLNSTPRISPWIGIEAAVWEQSGFGLIVQGGYSLAARVTEASASTADLRLLLRYDLSERASLYVGYRITSIRLHDHGSADEGLVRNELHETFSGPLAGLTLRF